MKIFFIILGALFIALSLIMVLKPSALLTWLRRHAGSRNLFIVAIVFRAVLAIAFFAFADLSGYPLAFQVIGLLAFAGALFVGLLGRASFADLVGWLADVIPQYVYRIEGLVGVLFGAFVIHAVV